MMMMTKTILMMTMAITEVVGRSCPTHGRVEISTSAQGFNLHQYDDQTL